ncbi:hypothetical protein HK096_001116 [Nowakowskiella sp. JEL0078]|nr:hypothetical protein HK096_001116 [Nowakowskiella sp. JEL0078]
MKKLYDHLNLSYISSPSSVTYMNISTDEDPTKSVKLPSQNEGFPFTNKTIPTSLVSNSRKLNINRSEYFSFSSYRLPFIDNTFPLPDLPSLSEIFSSLVFICVSAISVLIPLDFQQTINNSKSTFERFYFAIIIVRDFIRLIWIAKLALARGQLISYRRDEVPNNKLNGKSKSLQEMTLGEFFKEYRFNEIFYRDAFYPFCAVACTCSFDTLEEFPAVVILDYVGRSFPFSRMSFVSEGIIEVCNRLSAPIHSIHTSTSISGITMSSPDHISINAQSKSTFSEMNFNHVIFATQANQALRILSTSPTTVDFHHQQRILSAFHYTKSLVICHTDTNLLPSDSSAWRCMTVAKHNHQTSADTTTIAGYDPKRVAMCTHLTGMTFGGRVDPTRTQFLQTTNPILFPSPDKILSTSWFERCVVSRESSEAVVALRDVQGLGRRWFVGSFAFPGIPLLEGCVASSWEVAVRIVEMEVLGGELEVSADFEEVVVEKAKEVGVKFGQDCSGAAGLTMTQRYCLESAVCSASLATSRGTFCSQYRSGTFSYVNTVFLCQLPVTSTLVQNIGGCQIVSTVGNYCSSSGVYSVVSVTNSEYISQSGCFNTAAVFYQDIFTYKVGSFPGYVVSPLTLGSITSSTLASQVIVSSSTTSSSQISSKTSVPTFSTSDNSTSGITANNNTLIIVIVAAAVAVIVVSIVLVIVIRRKPKFYQPSVPSVNSSEPNRSSAYQGVQQQYSPQMYADPRFSGIQTPIMSPNMPYYVPNSSISGTSSVGGTSGVYNYANDQNLYIPSPNIMAIQRQGTYQ